MGNTFYDSVSIAESSGWRDVAFSAHSLRVVRRLIESSVQRYLADRASIRWVDVGCGLGRTYVVARQLGYNYTGIDSASAHIQHCQQTCSDGRFICDDWLSHSGEYDLVTFISVLHHFRDWRAALDRAFALLSPGGVVIVDHEPTRFFSRLFRAYCIWGRRADPAVIGEVEIHWFGGPSILPSELPEGQVQYHFDYFPVLGRLGLRTRRAFLGRFFESYRKIMQKPATDAGPPD